MVGSGRNWKAENFTGGISTESAAAIGDWCRPSDRNISAIADLRRPGVPVRTSRTTSSAFAKRIGLVRLAGLLLEIAPTIGRRRTAIAKKRSAGLLLPKSLLALWRSKMSTIEKLIEVIDPHQQLIIGGPSSKNFHDSWTAFSRFGNSTTR